MEAAKIVEEQFPNHVGISLLLVWYQHGWLTEQDFHTIQSLYVEMEGNSLNEQSIAPPFGKLPKEVLKNLLQKTGKQ
ncbi:hypothetical protein [Anaerobacillus alkalilacustris]|nr:hypothetical protein [Anaerobacillus alkalilacustris]